MTSSSHSSTSVIVAHDPFDMTKRPTFTQLAIDLLDKHKHHLNEQTCVILETAVNKNSESIDFIRDAVTVDSTTFPKDCSKSDETLAIAFILIYIHNMMVLDAIKQEDIDDYVNKEDIGMTSTAMVETFNYCNVELRMMIEPTKMEELTTRVKAMHKDMYYYNIFESKRKSPHAIAKLKSRVLEARDAIASYKVKRCPSLFESFPDIHDDESDRKTMSLGFVEINQKDVFYIVSTCAVVALAAYVAKRYMDKKTVK